mgnify:CR=1 FL=1
MEWMTKAYHEHLAHTDGHEEAHGTNAVDTFHKQFLSLCSSQRKKLVPILREGALRQSFAVGLAALKKR